MLLSYSDPCLLSLFCFANPCLAVWNCSSWTALYSGCPVPLLAVQSLRSLLHLPRGEAVSAWPDSHSDMRCNVIAAQSCPAIRRFLNLNPLCFHTSCSLFIFGCGKDSLFTYQTELFCTWKIYLSLIFICPSVHTACLWVLLAQHLCPHCRLKGGHRDSINSPAESLYQLHFNTTHCTLRNCSVQPYAVCLSHAITEDDS